LTQSIVLEKLISGAWVSDRATIGSSFTNHFISLFASSKPAIDNDLLNLFDTSISSEENQEICALPSEQEILSALSSIGSSKAPGPDGFTALFYKKYWDIVKHVVLRCVWDFFSTNHLLKEQNHIFIALVPKQLGPSSVSHFRPISLCNIIYKIISKILANRFKGLLHHFISPYQSAFVPSRSIQDNSILAHKLLHTIKSKKGRGGLMAVKIDMEKAFDRMEWSFLLAILHKLGFSDIWINWIRVCITSTSFSVLINGSPFGLFTPARGLRQGDPLSPFLFILGTEVMSRLLHHQESIGLLKGIRIARNCTPITHLLFADDLIIFAKTTSIEASAIKSSLDSYCQWSGQAVNSSKSSVLFSKNSTPTTISSITGILPFKPSASVPHYLGLPLLIGRSKMEAFQPLLTKVLGKIDGWRAKTLSQAGRAVLIKAIASTIPLYTMSTFLLPDSIYSALDKMFKDLWWGFPKGKSRNLCLKSWSSMCTPRRLGGLGFRLMKETNLALIAKLGWKILSDMDCLWVRHLREKYIRYGNFFSTSAISNASVIWKGILKSKPLLQAHACLQVSTTSHVPIWTSSWIPSIPSFKPSPKYPNNFHQPSLFISDLIVADTSQWNPSVVNSVFDDISAREILKTC
jgi:hypothetical protein